MNVTVFPLVLLASLNLPLAAYAQGTVRGAQEGAAQGAREGGPIGEVIGGAVGAVTGTIGGILGVDDRRHFHEYVARQHHPSYRYNELRVGAVSLSSLFCRDFILPLGSITSPTGGGTFLFVLAPSR
jgi:hypothetical protein